jgi:hypothetical protein
MEFSKKITIFVLVFHFALVLGVGIIKTLFGTDLEALLNYTMVLAVTVCGGYSVKAGVENYQKIKNSSQNINIENQEINNEISI